MFSISKYFLSIMFVSGSFLACAGMDSLRMETRGDKRVILHEVEEGETLYAITRRYKASLGEVVSQNKIVDNKIDLGQVLEIPTSVALPQKSTQTQLVTPAPSTQSHTVAAGETLYAISRKYGVKVDDLKAWNGLTSNALSTGQVLSIGQASTLLTKEPEKVVVKAEPKKEEPKGETKKSTPTPSKEKYTTYYVQTGEQLDGIARKFNTRVDSIVVWNRMKNTYLTIGQKLLIKGNLDSLAQTVEQKVEKTDYSTIIRQPDQSGFSKVLEEGIARKIEDIEESEKYLALHRTLKIGTLVEVRNLMNNKKIFVRIVGKLPETGLNENTLVRLSPICFKTLGIIDPQTRVEISYYAD